MKKNNQTVTNLCSEIYAEESERLMTEYQAKKHVLGVIVRSQKQNRELAFTYELNSADTKQKLITTTLHLYLQLTMVIQESLRLYPPAFFLAREAFETITFKNIVVPKGVVLVVPIPYLHQNPDIWGPNAHKFNPERFANGVFNACNSPQAYMPFGVGSRICAGQHLAMTELKVILSLILSKFCFSLSPAYQHSPSYKILTEPEHGVILCMRRM